MVPLGMFKMLQVLKMQAFNQVHWPASFPSMKMSHGSVVICEKKEHGVRSIGLLSGIGPGGR